jgi:hypothetical protein
MSKKPKIKKQYYFEAMDRASVLSDMLDRHLIQHPVCKLDKEVGGLVDEAAMKLYEAYQLLGQRYFESKTKDI